jgi:tetraacyldisaccharide 4'-kinase
MKPLRERSFFWRAVSPLAWPFALLYVTVIRLKNAAYDLRLSKPQRLSWPVLSVGNLSVGGTGKTPLVLLLAGLLEARDWTVDVLSRGYGRGSQRVAQVDPHTSDDNAAEQFGDEPLLLARHGISVYVGADRHQAGLLAERDTSAEFDPEKPRKLHILDDGFQHRKLARAVNIVLLQRADLDDDILPLGRLREPLCALERADICVLRAEDADLKDRVLRLMRQTDPARIWIVDRRTTLPHTLPTSKALAFCAIGDPRRFFQALQQTGIGIEKKIAFRDHHAYTKKDIDHLKAVALASEVQAFITTEKDSMRLANGLRAELENSFPLIVAGLEISLREEARSMELLESLLDV